MSSMRETAQQFLDACEAWLGGVVDAGQPVPAPER